MSWWLRTRAIPAALLAVAALLVATAALQQRVWPLPGLVPLAGGMPAVLLLPAVTAAVAAVPLAGGCLALESVAVRPVARWQRVVAVSLGVVPAVAFIAVAAALHLPGLAVAGRNLAGLFGLALLVGRVTTRAAAPLVPVLAAIVVATLGPVRDTPWWAWPVAPAGNGAAALTAAVLAALGVSAGLTRSQAAVVRALADEASWG